MHNNVKALLATTMLFFSSQSMASGGCAFDDKQAGFMATCSEEKQEVILTGAVTHQQLDEFDWFNDEYTNYKVDAEIVAKLQKVDKPTQVSVIIGTWCPDCHRETPRFIRLIEEINNPNIQVTYIGVDREKQDPQGLAANYEFSRIPTFIVEQNDEEIGRIVERPEVSLEADLLNIID